MNWIGTRTLVVREVSRFLTAPMQTLATPLFTTLLYFVAFGLGDNRAIAGGSRADFVVPGLVFLAIANTAYINSSTSVFWAKELGTLEDLLVAPLGPGEILAGLTVGGLVRGFIVGALTWVVPLLLLPAHAVLPLQTIFFFVLAGQLFSVFGVITGLAAKKFEQVTAWSTFLILPLTFLGGVFFQVEVLPDPLPALSQLNPIMHLVRGFRGAMNGTGDGTGPAALGSWAAVTAIATFVAYRILRSGWRLKS